MNGDHWLRSLTVEGYRGIRSLKLPDLGRVNLFVGKNNAGKSSLLEAIRLVFEENPGSVAGIIYELVREHADFSPRFRPGRKDDPFDSDEIEAAVSAVASLFWGGHDGQPTRPIHIFDTSTDRRLVIHGPRAELAQASLFAEDKPETDTLFFGPESPVVTIETPNRTRDIPLRLFLRTIPLGLHHRSILSIPASGLSSLSIRRLWEKLAVSGSVAIVDDAMRSIWPSFERALTAGEAGRRSIYVKMSEHSRAVPLQSLGDGVQRVFAITVALALAAGGTVIVDEIDNGLHHSAQAHVWNAIFSLSQRFDVQVFATTHSWEAVVEFQAVANENVAKGLLYRLEAQPDGSTYVERYTEADLARAAEHGVEVR